MSEAKEYEATPVYKQQIASKQKVQCKLCACEGVDGTVLCKEHLEGYQLAANTLLDSGITMPARMLASAIQQQKGSDNGKDGTK
jgi:hypothetical protein